MNSTKALEFYPERPSAQLICFRDFEVRNVGTSLIVRGLTERISTRENRLGSTELLPEQTTKGAAFPDQAIMERYSARMFLHRAVASRL